ncbi:hypothetical protein L211DRAFT_443576 [Terfezia boudieri ATCC MYA-4762]|uniref:Uncharacterized protein n=1 Tax=Terfezia boudieri ATCC MYA-4762 TaxID=1051890 RepID=A0A3N4LTK8_9PEZI|nr:hypothetical protein L211DRAFT_443576 [Terfezia boudieri ATCC MYA-4762]
MAESGTINAHECLDLVDTYIEIEKYFYRHNAEARKCKCLQFWGLLPATVGFTTKSNSCFRENMVKVDIFSWSGVETLVRRMNTSLVESILDCDCTACQWLHFLENIKTVERRARVISDMELFSAKGVSPTGNEPPKSLRECGSKAVLFAMLCYLGTPFMIYFDIWENSSRDPGKIGLMRFRLDKRLVFECFLRLYELQEIAEGGFSGSANQKHTLINERTNKFIEAFQQVERQFQPLQLSPRIQSLTVPNGTVFPFHDFRYQQHGGQAGIYVIKVLGEFREGLMKGHSTDVQSLLSIFAI